MNKDVFTRRGAFLIYNYDFFVERWRITTVTYDRQDERCDDSMPEPESAAEKRRQRA